MHLFFFFFFLFLDAATCIFRGFTPAADCKPPYTNKMHLPCLVCGCVSWAVVKPKPAAPALTPWPWVAQTLSGFGWMQTASCKLLSYAQQFIGKEEVVSYFGCGCVLTSGSSMVVKKDSFRPAGAYQDSVCMYCTVQYCTEYRHILALLIKYWWCA